jgi:hypothetical protein
LFSRQIGFFFLASLSLIVASIAFTFREQLKSRIYALLEIVFGMSLAGFSFHRGNTLLVTAIAFFAGIRVIVDGLKRLREFHSARVSANVSC